MEGNKEIYVLFSKRNLEIALGYPQPWVQAVASCITTHFLPHPSNSLSLSLCVCILWISVYRHQIRIIKVAPHPDNIVMGVLGQEGVDGEECGTQAGRGGRPDGLISGQH